MPVVSSCPAITLTVETLDNSFQTFDLTFIWFFVFFVFASLHSYTGILFRSLEESDPLLVVNLTLGDHGYLAVQKKADYRKRCMSGDRKLIHTRGARASH